MDVLGAYLNSHIDKDVYEEQAPGYEELSSDGTKLTCQLNKSLYGLKQCCRNWFTTLTTYLRGKGFTANQNDPCVYASTDQNVIILFWVDDIILAGISLDRNTKLKEMLHAKFKMDDRGKLRWFLGIEFQCHGESYRMSQQR